MQNGSKICILVGHLKTNAMLSFKPNTFWLNIFNLNYKYFKLKCSIKLKIF